MYTCYIIQGTILGGLIFIILFKWALLRPLIPRPLSRSKSVKIKYVDDASVGVSINLKESLIPDSQPRPKPLNFLERMELNLPDEHNLLQLYLSDLERYTQKKLMSINNKNQGKKPRNGFFHLS